MSDYAERFKGAIDEKIEEDQEDGLRSHLGASLIGGPCAREVWYSFRWAEKQIHTARMLRLFARGHEEEFRFEKWIGDVADKIWTTDPSTGEQIRISDFEGHFGGSLDGVISNPAGIEGNFLAEFKTHSEKSYKKLLLSGVKSSKPQHYVQMQIYLHYKPKLKGAFYFAINKNDDSLYVEYVERDPECAEKYIKVAADTLQAYEPPARMEGAGPFNFYCKAFCDYSDVCHNNKEPHKSCRSCAHWVLGESKSTYCTLHDKYLSVEEQKLGCDKYERQF